MSTVRLSHRGASPEPRRSRSRSVDSVDSTDSWATQERSRSRSPSPLAGAPAGYGGGGERQPYGRAWSEDSSVWGDSSVASGDTAAMPPPRNAASNNSRGAGAARRRRGGQSTDGPERRWIPFEHILCCQCGEARPFTEYTRRQVQQATRGWQRGTIKCPVACEQCRKQQSRKSRPRLSLSPHAELGVKSPRSHSPIVGDPGGYFGPIQ